MNTDYQDIMDALEKGDKDDALDLFSNSAIEIKLDVIFTLLTNNK